MSEKILQEILDIARENTNSLNFLKERMITKDDIVNLLTKDDIYKLRKSVVKSCNGFYIFYDYILL